MNTYEVTWILPDSTKLVKQLKADGYQVLPNGITNLLKAKSVAQIRLVSDGPAEQQYELVGSIAGYSLLLEIS